MCCSDINCTLSKFESFKILDHTVVVIIGIVVHQEAEEMFVSLEILSSNVWHLIPHSSSSVIHFGDKKKRCSSYSGSSLTLDLMFVCYFDRFKRNVSQRKREEVHERRLPHPILGSRQWEKKKEE